MNVRKAKLDRARITIFLAVSWKNPQRGQPVLNSTMNLGREIDRRNDPWRVEIYTVSDVRRRLKYNNYCVVEQTPLSQLFFEHS